MHSRVRKIALSLCTLLLPVMLFSQTTRVKGRVVDAVTGEGIPFVGMFLEGTPLIVTSDQKGYYVVETRDTCATALRAEVAGYETARFPLRKEAFQEVDFALSPIDVEYREEVSGKPDNAWMKKVLEGIDRNRYKNDPERRERYSCDVYSRIELDMANAEERIKSKFLRRNLGFTFEYMDTSAISGQPYLPFMLSETKSRRYHSVSPEVDKERIEANRISGVNAKNILSKFTGNLNLQTNFYNNFINTLNIEIPSPIGTGAEFFYDYYVLDTVAVEGRPTWKIRFQPKRYISTAAYDGDMEIDSADYALRSIHARLKKGVNVNWIRHLVVDIENQRLPDSTWFYKDDAMFMNFAVSKRDSSKIMSFIVQRQMAYANPDYSEFPIEDVTDEGGEKVILSEKAGEKDEQWWEDARLFTLTERERGIYTMVDSVKKLPLYKTAYAIGNMFATSYLEFGPIGFGPPGEIISHNNIEGLRLRMGVRTSREFSEKLRLQAYTAYGFKDEKFKGGASMIYMFDNYPTKKLSASISRDYMQLGMGSSPLGDNNLLSSIKARGGINKKSPVTDISLSYERELGPGFENALTLQHRRVFENEFVPMVTPLGEHLGSVSTTWLRYYGRLSWDERVTRGPFRKTHIYTKYPIVKFEVIAAPKGFLDNEFGFLRTEATVTYRLPTMPYGTTKFSLNAGHIFGQVPYTMLHIHEGNGTYIYDNSAFACMDYYEFASDTWSTLHLEHNFGGIFFNIFRLLRKAKLREAVTFAMTWGTLSDRNNGIVGTPESQNAIMLFPEGMRSLDTPYMEAGVGITNIFKLLRVDFIWRLNHRYYEVDGVRMKAPRCFTINVGYEITF